MHAAITEEVMSCNDRETGDMFMTYRKHSFVSGRSLSGLAKLTDKEMGNFIVRRYLENGFCEYWAGWI